MWRFVWITTLVMLSLCSAPANAQCIFNTTHCSCSIATSPGLCSRYSSGTSGAGTCYVDQCSATGRTCDCSGTELCTVDQCDAWKPDDPSQVLVLGELINCIFVPNGATCLSPPMAIPSASPSSSPSASATPTSSISPSSSSSMSISPLPSTSTSPSISPSTSASPSVSPSISPSSSPSMSISPLPSTSTSPSISPSTSTSPSVSPSISTSISPSISPSISVSASPSMSTTPSITPSASISSTPSATPSTSSSPSISSSSSATPSTSRSPSPTPPIPFICPNDNSTFNLYEFIPNTWGAPMSNFSFPASFGPGESATLRGVEIEGCNSVLIQSSDDYFDINIHPVITTSSPIFPGYCMLEGPSPSTMSFESHIALVFEANFNFKPSAVKLWDLDNLLVRDPNNALEVIPGVWAAETAAVFGARDGNVIIPSSSLDATTELELLTYTIPTSSMNAMGLSSLPEVVVPGAHMKASNGYMDVDWATDRITTGVTFSFAEPIDTLVIVYGFSDWHWAGDTDAKMYFQSPTLECP